MIKAGKPGFQSSHPVLQAGPGAHLHEEKMHQLVLAAESAGWAPAAVLSLQSGKMMSRNQFEHLLKDCVTMGHSPNFPVCLIGYG
jgi:hypothetical protein